MLGSILVLLLSVLGAQGLLKGKSAYERRGVSLLDATTFRKVVPRGDISVLLLVWNEAVKGDYGADSVVEDYYVFAERAEYEGYSDNVLFTQLVVNNWPNRNLSIEIDSTLEEYYYPRIYYFKPGDGTPIPYPQFHSINTIALNRFLSTATTFYLGVPGTNKDMYMLARSFIASETVEAMQSIIIETQEKVKALTEVHGTGFLTYGNYYVKTMEKVIASGISHVKKELSRLEDLVSDATKKISVEKRNELQTRVNILHNFMTLEGLGLAPDSEMAPRRAVKPVGLDLDAITAKGMEL